MTARAKRPRTKKKPSGAKGGRPAYEFTKRALKELSLLARAANTIEDIAAILGVSKRTLERRIVWRDKVDAEEQDDVARAYHEALAERRSSLRVAQHSLAIGRKEKHVERYMEGDKEVERVFEREVRAPNCSMLIWLGKQELGQRDFKQLEVTGPGGGPLTIDAELVPELTKKLFAFLKNRGGDDAGRGTRRPARSSGS